jgi:hypothetical protein
VPTITEIFAQAQLSRAAYAKNLEPGMYGGNNPESPYVNALTDSGMSATQAEHFADTYAVVVQSPESADSGLSATVFQDSTTGAFSIAIRGTDPRSLTDWVGTNLGDIGAQGISVSQGIDLYNWLQRLFGQKNDDVVQYIYFPNAIDEITGESIPPHLVATTSLATGELYGQITPLAAAGHSLGGHLAMILSRLTPEMVSARVRRPAREHRSSRERRSFRPVARCVCVDTSCYRRDWDLLERRRHESPRCRRRHRS